jgi:hypothetical protein
MLTSLNFHEGKWRGARNNINVYQASLYNQTLIIVTITLKKEIKPGQRIMALT